MDIQLEPQDEQSKWIQSEIDRNPDGVRFRVPGRWGEWIDFYPSPEHDGYVHCEHIADGVCTGSRRPFVRRAAHLFARGIDLVGAVAEPIRRDPAPPAKRIVEAEPDRGIYFIEAEGLGAVKIGNAIDVAKRMLGLQCACPVPLKLIGLVEWSDLWTEGQVHRHFSHLRARGEWFRLEPEIVEFIRTHGREIGNG